MLVFRCPQTEKLSVRIFRLSIHCELSLRAAISFFLSLFCKGSHKEKFTRNSTQHIIKLRQNGAEKFGGTPDFLEKTTDDEVVEPLRKLGK